MNKIVFVLMDGAAGRPCKSLGGKSSLEAARTPVIDSLFHHSVNGLMHVVGPSIAPQSDIACFATLGYNPFNVPSRGVTEAIGAGMDYQDGELALRCNITSVKGDKLTGVRIAHLTKAQGLEIERLINEGVSLDVPFTFKHTVGYRGVLIIHEQLSDKVSNTHPGYIRERLGDELVSYAEKLGTNVQIKNCKPLAADAVRTAELINDFSSQAREVLTNSGLVDQYGNEANYVLTRGAGSELPFLKSFKEVYGLNAGLIAEMPVELGVAELLGLGVIKEPESLSELSDVVLDSLKDYDLVYAHIKGPDKYGHLGDAHGKVREIERIDMEFLKPLINKLDLKNTTVCVTSDHATPACFGSHSSDPVPYLITNGESMTGHFDEKSVNQTFIEGKELMSKLIETARV